MAGAVGRVRPDGGDNGPGGDEPRTGDGFAGSESGTGRTGEGCGRGTRAGTGFSADGTESPRSTMMMPAGGSRVPPPAGIIIAHTAAATWAAPDRRSARARIRRSPAEARNASAGA